MKKGDIFKGTITESQFPDSSYVNYEGEKVLIKKGILGQTVEKRKARGKNFKYN